MKETRHEIVSYLQVTIEMNITQLLRFQQMAWYDAQLLKKFVKIIKFKSLP